MSNTIQVNRGAYSTLPTLNAGELAFTTDSYRLFVGDGSANHELAILSGTSGGQDFYGGTASGNDLELHSTIHATKGNVIVHNIKLDSLLEGAALTSILVEDSGTVKRRTAGELAWKDESDLDSRFLRSDADDVGAHQYDLTRLYLGGGDRLTTTSSADLQVRGFIRSGTIYIHEGGS